MDQNNKTFPVILGAALIISFSVFGLFYYSAQSVDKDLLSVTGSTKTRVTSDSVKLIIVLFRTVPASNIASGNASIARDLNLVNGLLSENAVSSGITVSPVFMDQYYGEKIGGENSFHLRQTVTVESGDIDKITKLSKSIPDLAGQGAVVSVQSLEYYYSKLPELRVSLLSDAVKDAKARADKIAESTGRKVGKIRSASIGVVQVIAPNSVDISDYGNL